MDERYCGETHRDRQTDSISLHSNEFIHVAVLYDALRWTHRQIDTLHWFSQRRSRTPYFGVRTQRAITSKFELGWDFCTLHLAPSFIMLYVNSFGNYRVDKQTNRQTPLKTSNVLRYATTLGNEDDRAAELRQATCVNWLLQLDTSTLSATERSHYSWL